MKDILVSPLVFSATSQQYLCPSHCDQEIRGLSQSDFISYINSVEFIPMQVYLLYLRRLSAQTFGPASNAFATCSATTSWTGYVGCSVFNQKYWLTGTPQLSTKLSGSEVPLQE